MTHTSALVAARQSGVLKRWRMTPLSPAAYLGSRVAATVALAAASGAVTIVAGLLFAGVRIDGFAAVGLLVVLVLGATPLTAHDLLVPAAWAVAGFLVAQRSFRWEPA